MHVCLLTQLSSNLCDPGTVSHEAPLSMGFSRQKSWGRLPLPPPGDLLDPGITPGSPALQAYSLQSEPRGKPILFQSAFSISYYVIALGQYDLVVIRQGGKPCMFYKHSFTNDLSMPCEVKNYHWDNSHI